jgi:hypothetical protein
MKTPNDLDPGAHGGQGLKYGLDKKVFSMHCAKKTYLLKTITEKVEKKVAQMLFVSQATAASVNDSLDHV